MPDRPDTRLKIWLDNSREIVLRRLNTGAVRSTLRNYLLCAFLAGLLVGAGPTALWASVGAILVLLIGAGAGYSARSYISFRRRQAARRRHRDSGGLGRGP